MRGGFLTIISMTTWVLKFPARQQGCFAACSSGTNSEESVLELLGVASGIRCKSDGRGSGFVVMLGDGTDILSGVSVLAGGYCVWPELAGRVQQRAAQVLQQPEAVGGHGQAAPAAGGPVQDSPDQGQAGGLAGQPGR